MFTSSMTDVTFWMFSCTEFRMRELWNCSAVRKQDLKQGLWSCKWPSSVAAAVMHFLRMCFLGRAASYPGPPQGMGKLLYKTNPRWSVPCSPSCTAEALSKELRLHLKSQLTNSSNHVTYLEQFASDSPHLSLSYYCLARGYRPSHTFKSQQL